MTKEQAIKENRIFKKGDKVNIETIPNGHSASYMLRETNTKNLKELCNKVFTVDSSVGCNYDDGDYLESIYLTAPGGIEVGIFTNMEITHIS